MNKILEEVKSRIDIVDIISEYVVLKKHGNNWSGLCPFHLEETPSFIVSPDKKIFKCFGCGLSGDVFTFLQNINKALFYDVLIDLASKYGVSISSDKNFELRKKILGLNKLVASYFHGNLFSKSGSIAMKYLNDRGIYNDSIKKFNLGYANDSWNDLHNYLSEMNFSNNLLLNIGFIKRNSDGNKYYDKFRDRIIFPLCDAMGRPVGFGGRSLNIDNKPKYLNSSSSIIFNKSKILYCLHEAKKYIKEKGCVILVEGYFDVIKSHLSGVKNVVGVMGTSLTNGQLLIIGKYSKNIYIAFDGDDAGIAASKRCADLAEESFNDCDVRIVKIPSGFDPDDFVSSGGDLNLLVKEAPTYLDFKISEVINCEIETIDEKYKIFKDIIIILRNISNPLLRTEYIKVISQKLSIKELDIIKEIDKPAKDIDKNIAKDIDKNIAKDIDKNIAKDIEQNLISLFFLRNNIWNLVLKNIEGINFSENIEIIVDLIKKNIGLCESVNDLSDKIFTDLNDNDLIKDLLSDILFSLEDKQCLNDNDSVLLFIKENIRYVSKLKNQEVEKYIKERYNNGSDLELQELKKILEAKLENEYV